MSKKKAADTTPAAEPAVVDIGSPIDARIMEEEARLVDADAAVAEEITDQEQASIEARQRAQQTEKIEEGRRQAAIAGSSMGIEIFSQILKHSVHEQAELQGEEKEALINALAPVLLKTKTEPPAWYVENKEIVDFLVLGVGIGIGVGMRVHHAKKAEAKAAADDANQQQGQPA